MTDSGLLPNLRIQWEKHAKDRPLLILSEAATNAQYSPVSLDNLQADPKSQARFANCFRCKKCLKTYVS